MVPALSAVIFKVLVVPLPDIFPFVAVPVPSLMVMFVAAILPGSALNVKVRDGVGVPVVAVTV